MYIPNDDIKNCPFCRLQLVVDTFGPTNKDLCSDLRDKIMVDTLMYIPNDDSQNCAYNKLQLVVETFIHSTQ